MASFIPSPIDRLTQLLEQRIHTLNFNLQNQGNPPEDIIYNLVKDISDKLSQFIKQAPIRVKKIVASAFTTLGWDVIRGRGVQRIYSLKKLVECLQTIIVQLNNYNHQPIVPTFEEINDIGLASQKLWDLDNRLQSQIDYILDLQIEKNPNNHSDMADRPLFQYVNPEVLQRPTFKSFIALLDNYIADEGRAEVVSESEKKRERGVS